MKRIAWNAPPSLAVIDRAIEIIKAGEPTHFSCHALEAAVLEVEFGVRWYGPSHWSGAVFAQRMQERTWLYRKQYRRCVRFSPGSALWWDSASRYKKERIAALKAFKQACIDAAKKGQPRP